MRVQDACLALGRCETDKKEVEWTLANKYDGLDGLCRQEVCLSKKYTSQRDNVFFPNLIFYGNFDGPKQALTTPRTVQAATTTVIDTNPL